MRTCWVVDHPAHVRLLAPFLRCSNNNDVIIATKRKEVKDLIDAGDGYIPRRQIHWVERPVGKGIRKKALTRWRSSHQFLAECCRTGQPISRIIVVGAPLELMAWRSPLLRRTLKSITTRIYITDTEVNHIAHKLALKSATHVVVPTHWDSSIDDNFIVKARAKRLNVLQLNGLHGHVHLTPGIYSPTVANPPKIMVRELLGDGIHDGGEIIPIPAEILDGLSITRADENRYEGNPWDLDRELAKHDGVITQSRHLQVRQHCLVHRRFWSVLLSGFLSRLSDDGYPLFIWDKACKGDEWKNLYAQFLAGIHLRDAIETSQWPDAKSQLAEFLNMKLID